MSWMLTLQVLPFTFLPGRNPTATREGIPTARASTAIEAANCSQ